MIAEEEWLQGDPTVGLMDEGAPSAGFQTPRDSPRPAARDSRHPGIRRVPLGTKTPAFHWLAEGWVNYGAQSLSNVYGWRIDRCVSDCLHAQTAERRVSGNPHRRPKGGCLATRKVGFWQPRRPKGGCVATPMIITNVAAGENDFGHITMTVGKNPSRDDFQEGLKRWGRECRCKLL